MAFSTSFHTSARGHSVKNTVGLAKIQRHNSRGYQAWDYSADKIVGLIGTPKNIVRDTQVAIDYIFEDALKEYNNRQKRDDRKIYVSPYQHFDNNKKMDIAVESIFQIGDKEFWDEFRTDDVIIRNRKEYVRHSFPDEVKAVMNDIFLKQTSAYANIYQTHGAEILDRVVAEHNAAVDLLNALGEEKNIVFNKIYNLKAKEREKILAEMDDKTQGEYAAFAGATNTLTSIKEMKLIERIEGGMMHINVVNLTAHYDENSPHAHNVSFAWADGFQNGLGSRIAKSVVLNRWALEVLQERMHEIAQEEIDKHPEIFHGRQLAEKQKGRNYDYTKEFIQRCELARLQRNVIAVDQHINAAVGQIKHDFEGVVANVIDNVISDNDVYAPGMFLLAASSDKRFAELDREGQDLMKSFLPTALDLDPERDGLIAVLEKASSESKGITWQERQNLWDQYRAVSNEFWEIRKDLAERTKALLSLEYDLRRNAKQSYYDAITMLHSTKSIFGALIAFAWALHAIRSEKKINENIDKLKLEQKQLQEATRSFKKYSNAYREDLKAGKMPYLNYLHAMEDVVKVLDAEAAAQPQKKVEKALEHKNGPQLD